jgi:hypothetical protein
MVIHCELLGGGANTYMCPTALVEPTPKLHALVVAAVRLLGACEVPKRTGSQKTRPGPPASRSQRQKAGITAIGKPSPYPLSPFEEGHGFVKREHQRDELTRSVEWLQKYLQRAP